MRTMLVAVAVAVATSWIGSEARAQWGPTDPGGEYIGGSAQFGGLAPTYVYGGGYYRGASYAASPISGVPVYGGYGGYAPYGYRVYGRGRTFGAYQPRFYRSYQPRRFGMFDR